MNLIARLRRSTRGVALTEFAYVLPVLLLFGLGGAEAGHYVLAYLRVSQIAETVADNAGRARSALDETDINDIMIGAKLMGKNLNIDTNGRIILSDLEQRTTTTGANGVGPTSANNPNGYRQWIRWQRCIGALSNSSSYGVPIDGNGNPVTNLSATGTDHGAVQNVSIINGMGPTGRQIAASSGTAVMVVEVFYNYRPLIPLYSFGSPTIHIVQAFNIRQRTDFSVYNANNLTGTKRSDCSLRNASIPTS